MISIGISIVIIRNKTIKVERSLSSERATPIMASTIDKA